MRFLVFTAILAACSLVSAEDRTTFRDKSGRLQGTGVTRKDGVTTFRDSSGRSLGTAKTSGKNTTFRDSSGKLTGSAFGAKPTGTLPARSSTKR